MKIIKNNLINKKKVIRFIFIKEFASNYIFYRKIKKHNFLCNNLY